MLVLVMLALLVLRTPFLAFFPTSGPTLLLAHIAVLYILRVVQAEDRTLQARLRHSLQYTPQQLERSLIPIRL